MLLDIVVRAFRRSVLATTACTILGLVAAQVEAQTTPPRPRSSSTAEPRAGRSTGGTARGGESNAPQVWVGWVVMGRGDNPSDRQMQIELTITGNTITGREIGGRNRAPPGGLGSGTFVMDAAAGTLDATATAGPNTGKVYPGIFQLQGNTLRWCVSNNERRRPQQMASVGASSYLLILERQAAQPQQPRP